MTQPAPITGQTETSLTQFLAAHGLPAFRAKQILDWIWDKRVESFERMTNLPATLKNLLGANFSWPAMETVQIQGKPGKTRKFLSRLDDGQCVESVIIPAATGGDGGQSERLTLCVSSQVGCAFGCKFCASGLLGFSRNLNAGEIVGQILAAERITRERIDNLVFMGMGEPLANFDNLVTALDIITAPWGLNIGGRHITVSTSGYAPNIVRLASYPRQIRLAISLHGATDDVRNQIMPVNKKWPLRELVPALAAWASARKQMITMEYILIQGVNDSLEAAGHLASLAQRLNAKVNLIPYNTVEGLDWQRPPLSHCERFRDRLKQAGIPVTLRYEKGHDIDAACGQLRLKKLKEDGQDILV
ncbi:23S rRNA (adenine(2503)-C(2))-methyltransferase RlmN [Akkermansia sp. N21169]|uniref:23S rRNA (adenine(2503)-C(2))-methyltransferase RlmN n=1 Tax=Akkermansia sp. N21169 TaxID=3040765 RepID=UPI00244E9375|nr:23S rRNA (adenine(2503)-C(2))-methyltransferase RlmN [Akkermansia sp. N21169]MDH3069144.1 23S rRNA (adenine(2503)-C(2))-methyltransferase RlmN [Akkermansia sp. N21169]